MINDGLDFRFYAKVAKRRIGFFLIPLIVALAIGTGIVASLPKMFNSSAKILVESQQIPDVFVQSTVTALASERLQIIQQRVLTRENLLKLAEKFQLFTDRKGLSKTELVELLRERIDFSMLDIGLLGKKGKKDDRLSVAFSIGFDYERPDAAAKVVNELVTIVLEEDIRNRVGRAGETTKFLSREAERLATELAALEDEIGDFKLKNSDTLPEKLAFNMNLLERNERGIEDVERSIAASEDQKRLLEFEASVKQAAGNGAGAAQGGGNALEQQLSQLQSAYEQRAVLYAPSHPEMRTLNRQISVVQKEIEQAKTKIADAKPVSVDDPSLGIEMRLIAQKISAIDQSIVRARSRGAELEKSVETLKTVVLMTPGVGATLQSMERKRQTLQGRADEISAKLGLAKLGERMEEDQQAERFEVIEAPIVPQEPISPNRAQLMFLTLGAAISLGGATAFGAEFLDNTIRRGKDITQKLNLRLLVTIPYIETRRELRRRRGKIFALLGAAIVAALLAAAAVHFFYSPLDLLMFRAMKAFNL
jgi:polysaccharide biosynthesis transport protein